MTNCVNKRNILNLLKVCVAEILKPEYRKPLQMAAVLSIAIFGIMFAVRIISEGYTLIIKTGLIPIEVMNTIVGGCACVIGGYLFVYFCIWPASVYLRMFKNVSKDKPEARGE